VSRPLAGRSALVTGASRGIGEASARALAAQGARVLLVARGADPLVALAAALGPGASAHPADLAVPAAVAQLAEEVMRTLGAAPDILVHAAGSFPLGAVEATSDAAIDEALALNVAAPLRLTRAFLHAMRVRGSGDVVTIGSVADRVVFPGNALYGASKHAVRAVHETLRAETRGSGVRATLIAPAATDTALWDAHAPERNPALPSRAEMLQAADVADAVAWVVTRPAHVDIEELRLARS
jgi:NADP-dependent 3-hydroxy acid dehydrogenase YdfG